MVITSLIDFKDDRYNYLELEQDLTKGGGGTYLDCYQYEEKGDGGHPAEYKQKPVYTLTWWHYVVFELNMKSIRFV